MRYYKALKGKHRKKSSDINFNKIFFYPPPSVKKWQPTPVFLPGESQGRGSLLGCRLWGHIESDTTEVMQQQQSKENETKINQWDLIILKNSGTAKEVINKMKRQPQEWEKILAKM